MIKQSLVGGLGGFLGTGKTTLRKHKVQNKEGFRVTVIIKRYVRNKRECKACK